MVATTGNPQVPAVGAKSQPGPEKQSSAQNYLSLARTPSPFASREDEDYFDLLSNTEFDFMQLPDVDVDVGEATRLLVDEDLGVASSGTSEQVQRQWYTATQSGAGMNTSQGETFDSANLATSIPNWIPTNRTVPGPTCASTVSGSTIPTPSDCLRQPDYPPNASRTIHTRPRSDPGDSYSEEIDHMTACGEMIRMLIIKGTAKMGTLDLILSDCKEYITRLGEIVRDAEFERSAACRTMVCTTVNLVIGQLERCVVVDTPTQPIDVDVGTHILSPASSCPASNTPSESCLLQQTIHFRCPLPNVSFGALQYDGKEQLVFCSNLMQTEASRALRLVRLLQHRQAGNGKCQASVSAAKIQDLWCKDFTTRLQNLLRPLMVERKAIACEI